MEFVLLVLVCFLCICPKAKEASYSVAYPLVGYGTILVTIQYIYGMLCFIVTIQYIYGMWCFLSVHLRYVVFL